MRDQRPVHLALIPPLAEDRRESGERLAVDTGDDPVIEPVPVVQRVHPVEEMSDRLIDAGSDRRVGAAARWESGVEELCRRRAVVV